MVILSVAWEKCFCQMIVFRSKLHNPNFLIGHFSFLIKLLGSKDKKQNIYFYRFLKYLKALKMCIYNLKKE